MTWHDLRYYLLRPLWLWARLVQVKSGEPFAQSCRHRDRDILHSVVVGPHGGRCYWSPSAVSARRMVTC